jgi:hypothetical protein
MNGDMQHDELFERLARLDPAGSAPMESATGPRAAALMEQIMQTDVTPAAHVPSPARRRRPLLLAIGGLALASVAVVGFVAFRGDNATAPTTLALSVGSSAAGTRCMQLDASTSQPDGTVAFRGTVESVLGNTVTLNVTTWYANGTADQVVVTTGTADGAVDPELSASFEQGGDYLVSAVDGQVNGCGMTGPYSAELEALYMGWFPAP